MLCEPRHWDCVAASSHGHDRSLTPRSAPLCSRENAKPLVDLGLFGDQPSSRSHPVTSLEQTPSHSGSCRGFRGSVWERGWNRRCSWRPPHGEGTGARGLWAWAWPRGRDRQRALRHRPAFRGPDLEDGGPQSAVTVPAPGTEAQPRSGRPSRGPAGHSVDQPSLLAAHRLPRHGIVNLASSLWPVTLNTGVLCSAAGEKWKSRKQPPRGGWVIAPCLSASLR